MGRTDAAKDKGFIVGGTKRKTAAKKKPARKTGAMGTPKRKVAKRKTKSTKK